MQKFNIEISELSSFIPELKTGDKVLLNGTVYTARDAAHSELISLIKKNEKLPFDLKNAVIYYAGPTPAPKGKIIGSCGPTTSKRMDAFTPLLYDKGVIATIGKGERSDGVKSAIKRNRAVYFCAVGGAGALLASCITECEVIAFPKLGCEAVRRLTIKDFPVTVGIDACGNSIFDR